MIKTKELIEKVSKLGFDIERHKNPFSNVKSNYDLITISLYDEVLVEIWTNCQYAISTISDGHSCYLYGYDVDELYKVCFEYANTPVEDREDKEKKFYLRHKYLTYNGTSDSKGYLNINLNNLNKVNALFIDNKTKYDDFQTEFTLKEIEEIKKKFDTDLSDFEIVEVEDESN